MPGYQGERAPGVSPDVSRIHRGTNRCGEYQAAVLPLVGREPVGDLLGSVELRQDDVGDESEDILAASGVVLGGLGRDPDH